MTRKILITGAGGFLGRHLLQDLIKQKQEVVALCHSELPARKIQMKYDNVPVYCLDISSNKTHLDFIVKKHNIEYVIHAAAMKHVGLCESNPTRAIETNIIGSKNVLEACLDNNIKNLIGISTDKAINPKCCYGATKFLMEQMFLEKKFSIFRGVNFLFSDGSVLDIWKKQMSENKPITINSRNTTRYFIDINNVSKFLINNLDTKGEIIMLEKCYKIKLHDLARAYCLKNKYYKTTEYKDFSTEKLEEEIPENIQKIDVDIDKIVTLLNKKREKNDQN